MLRCGLALVLTIGVGLCVPARASPVPMSLGDGPAFTPFAVAPAPIHQETPRQRPAANLADAASFPYQDLRSILQGSLPFAQLPDPAAEHRIQPLPAPPSSASLFLYAVGTIGAWQISRSARKLNLAEVPAWLHTGGPDQVGRAVRFDPLDLRLQPAAGLSLSLPQDDPPQHWTRSALPELRCSREGFLTISTARGPPRAATARAFPHVPCNDCSVA